MWILILVGVGLLVAFLVFGARATGELNQMIQALDANDLAKLGALIREKGHGSVHAHTVAALAAGKGNLPALQMMADAGVDLDAQSGAIGAAVRTPLMAAVLFGNTDVAKYLLEQIKVNPSRATDGGGGRRTPLHFAALGGSAEAARTLLGVGADVSAKTGEGQTPLMYAAMCGHLEVVKALLESGAKAGTADKNGRTAKVYAQYSISSEQQRNIVKEWHGVMNAEQLPDVVKYLHEAESSSA